MREKDGIINPDEAEKIIEKLIKMGNPTEIGIFISLLSQRYIKEMSITKEQFLSSLSNSIDKLEKGKK